MRPKSYFLPFLSLLGALGFVVTTLLGCNETTIPCDVGCCGLCGNPYSFPTAPESLITNLQVSYRLREIEHYAELLAPEFIFKFQPIDANEIGATFWTRDQDSTGTRALLTTTVISEIRINLTYGARDSSVNMAFPVDSLKIRIITTDLQVDQMDGITWIINDQQDLFFRKGKITLAESPDRWFIYEWDDLPTLRAPGVGVEPITWGKIKTLYVQ